MLAQGLNNGSYRRSFLADSHINAIDRFPSVEILTLVDYRVDGDGGLADLAVTDNKLTLSATDGHHRVNSLDTRLQRLVNRLTENYTGSLTLQRHQEPLPFYRAAAVDRLAKDVDYTAEHSLPYRNGSDLAGAANRHVLRHLVHVVEQDDAHVALLKVEGNAFHAVLKLHKLVGAHVVKPIDMSHTVAHLQHCADLFKGHGLVDAFKLLL